MPLKLSRLTKKPQDYLLNQIIALRENLVSLQEDLTKIIFELRSLFQVSEYAEIKLLIFYKTHNN